MSLKFKRSDELDRPVEQFKLLQQHDAPDIMPLIHIPKHVIQFLHLLIWTFTRLSVGAYEDPNLWQRIAHLRSSQPLMKLASEEETFAYKLTEYK